MHYPTPNLTYRLHPNLQSKEQVPPRPGQIQSFSELQPGQELEWVDVTAEWMGATSQRRFRPVTVEAIGARMCGGMIVGDHYPAFMHSKELFLAPDERNIVLRAHDSIIPVTHGKAPYFMNFRPEECGIAPYMDLEGQVLGWSAAYLRTPQPAHDPASPS